jgi:hypothetical protein
MQADPESIPPGTRRAQSGILPGMVSSAADARAGPLPALWGFLGFLLLGILAVLTLPQIADHLPHFGRAEEARFATTCLGLLALTVAYLYFLALTRPVRERAWLAPTLIYFAGLVIIKFILSPTAFQKSSGASLGGFVTAGIVVMPLYIGGLGLMYSLAVRKQKAWTFSSRLRLAVGFAVAAIVARLVVALILGTASDYLGDLVGAGLILPVVVAAASLAVMESFERAGSFRKELLYLGTAVVLADHLLWIVYMNRLF